jgi:chaperonin cofactor prefoldin
MDSLENQVTILSTKIDALHQMVEQLNQKTAEAILDLKGSTAGSYAIQSGASSRGYSYQRPSSHDASMEHKDVLVDTNYPESDSQSGDRALSPEIQIQRLTAQLTAAYNRIAALEEQLLLRRVHH